MLNKSFNVFPILDGALIAASGQKFLSNTMPSVVVDEVTIENNGDDTAQVSVDLSYIQKVKQAFDPNWWFLSSSRITSNYRVRLIASYNRDTNAILDFVSQRMNEYQAEMMSTKGKKGALSFVDVMSQYRIQDSNVSDVLSSLGPFSVGDVTTLIKGSKDNTVTYTNPSLILSRNALGSVTLLDIPAIGAIEKNQNGNPDVFYEDGLGRVSLKTLSFSVDNQLLQEDLSLYAFVYLDVTDRTKIRPKNKVVYSLQTSSGFIDFRTVLGRKNRFAVQTMDTAPLGPVDMKHSLVNDSSILNDLRLTEQADKSDISVKLSEDILDPIRRMLSVDSNQKPTIDVIKDTNCFSDLWISRSDMDIKRFVFSYDLKSFLVKESSFPILYTKPLIANELLNGGDLIQDFERASVKYICVKKRQVEFESFNSTNDIGTSTRNKKINPSATYPEEIVTIPRVVQDIFLESSNTQDNSVLFYEGVDSCQDSRKTQSLSKFQYGVKISVTDPALLYLRRVISDLDDMSKSIERIYDMIKNSPPIDNNEESPAGSTIINGRGLVNGNGTKRVVPLYRIGVDGTTAEQIVNNVISKYVSYAQKFELIPPAPIRIGDGTQTPVGLALQSLARSTKVESILQISSYIDRLAFTIEKVINVELPNGRSNEGNVSRSNIEQKGFLQTKFVLLEKTHFFSNAIEYGNLYQTGYDYINLNYDQGNFGLPQYSRRGLQNIFIREFNKYFGEYPNQDAPARQIVPEGTYSDSAITFYTPSAIKVFGKQTINQPLFVDESTNSVKYNINVYADLFLDIVKLKKETETHSPFLEIQNKSLDTSLRDGLVMEGCVVVDGLTDQFETYQVGDVKKTPANKQKEKFSKFDFSKVLAPDLFNMFLGGDKDDSDTTKNYLGLADTPLKPKNFGIVDFLDKDAIRLQPPSNPPTKLMFNVLGEMHFNPIIKKDTEYENKTYNSMTEMSKRYNVTEENITAKLQGDLSMIPNQYKSMMVLASSANRLSLGSGFDAKRFYLEDQDVSSVDKVITAIYEGTTYPPFQNAKDPMKVYSKFLTFWMNYKQIAVLEYLAGFDSLEQEGNPSQANNKKLLPIWKKFTTDFYYNSSGRKFLCRLRNISKEDLAIDGGEGLLDLMPLDSVDLFDLPIYNKYFMLMPEEG